MPKKTSHSGSAERRAAGGTVDAEFLESAVSAARDALDLNEGGPFGAVVVFGGTLVGRGHNRVVATNDPTAHAEIVAIREACRTLGRFSLAGCRLYASCEPCPMCLGAAYWARVDQIFYSSTRADAAAAGFDDAFLYEELALPAAARRLPLCRIETESASALFQAWCDKPDKIPY